MWKVCLGQLSELQQEALQQALEAESWLNPQPWTRARYPTCRSLTKTAKKKPRPTSKDFLSSLHEMHPYSVDPLSWKLKGYDFVSSENKPTRQNTPRWTEENSTNSSCFSIFVDGDCGRCDQEKRYKRTRGRMEKSADRTETRITRRTKEKKQWQENRNREIDVWK